MKPKRQKTRNIIKWLIWVPWIAAIILVAVKSGGYSKVDPFYQTTFGLSISDVYGLITYLFVLALIVFILFLILVITGIWMRKTGRLLNQAVFAVHKIDAVTLIVLGV